MGEQVSSVTVVGGGDSGMLTALAIRQLHPDMTIRVVDDFSEDPPNVGKSTFYAIMTLFHDFLEIDETRFYHEVKPVWKGSVFFRDWCGYDPFHFAFDARSKKPNPASPRSGQSLYYHYKTQSLRTVAEEIVDQQKTPILFSPSDGSYAQYPYMAYHLPLRRFSAFLKALCGERDVDLVDDRVTDVTVGSNGQTIRRVSSDTQVYQSDLYIDCTGFRRLLISELDAEYKHFDIPLDAAVHATADHTLGDIEPATIVETGEYGWFWQIDTHDNRDLGYVYSSAHLDQDAAVAELDAHRDEEFTTVEHYAFDSGFYEDAWVGNCIANGNAVGFIEPLQSTALTTHLKVAMRLSRMLASHARYNTPALREGFNKYVRASWNSIYDFISVHYKFAAGENDFWQEMQSIPLSEKVEAYINYYDRNGLELLDNELVDDAGTELGMISFATTSLYLLMMNMGAKSSFYEEYDIPVERQIRDRVDSMNQQRESIVAECLSYEEVYRGGIVDEYEMDMARFQQAARRIRPQSPRPS